MPSPPPCWPSSTGTAPAFATSFFPNLIRTGKPPEQRPCPINNLPSLTPISQYIAIFLGLDDQADLLFSRNSVPCVRGGVEASVLFLSACDGLRIYFSREIQYLERRKFVRRNPTLTHSSATDSNCPLPCFSAVCFTRRSITWC